jgi:hypothetical protein
MSWWQTGKERLWIGDSPADKVADGLKQLTAARAGRDQPKPALPEFLAALLVALRRYDGRLLNVVATVDGARVAAAGASDPAMESDLANVALEARKTYQDDLKREATTQEIVACFLFILGSRAERYLSGVKAEDIQNLEAKFAE